MLKKWVHSKRESISRKTHRMVNVTSYTRTVTLEHAGTNANTREVYLSKTLKTWIAGEISQTVIHSKFIIFIPADKFLSSQRTVKCTKHNWKLDVSTMKYVNPPDSFMQEELGKFFQHLYFGLVIIGLCLECGCWPVTFFRLYMSTTRGIFLLL